MKARIERLRAKLFERGLEALIVVHPPNRRYLTGFTGSAGIVLITENEADLITDFRYETQAMEEAPEVTVDIAAAGEFFHRAAKRLGARDVRKVGFEAAHLTWSAYQALTEAYAAEWTPTEGLVEALRMIKDAEEIARIRAAVDLADRAFTHVINAVKAGVRERDLSLELEWFMRRNGAEGIAFPTIVASGARGSLPHGVASDQPIGRDTLITLDYGAVRDGYVSDITRTIAVGEPPKELLAIYEIVRRAQEAALRAVRPGASAKDVDRAARAYIEEHGYGPRFGHSTGHGIGLEVHEGPAVSAKSEAVLEPGMVITVEPGIYLPGLGGVRIEDDVLVTETGAEVLTTSPKTLIVAG
ncbi:MAG: aminopeptidase P family protein [Hydrogenibacillus sp.]|nr:aminopeptidase P family protein [Hydrogenibacillus sp.]